MDIKNALSFLGAHFLYLKFSNLSHQIHFSKAFSKHIASLSIV